MSKKTIYDSLFILLLTGICHVLFSKYGFNPTDEGFVLSATNRVLHGQIPHVDFSSVRPLGYAYLHIPELLISKTHFFLVSRFVFWLEEVLIAFLWVRLLIHYSQKKISMWQQYALVVLCFIFNVHYFPASVLHTIDGLLLCMMGLNLLTSETKWNFVGYLFIGGAALCKQNYLAVLPVTIFLFSKRNTVFNLITGFSPIAVYLAFIGLHGGLQDISTQLSGHNELVKVGVLSYLFNPMIYVGLVGMFFYHKFRLNKLVLIIFVLVIATALLITNHYHGKYVFLFFGIICGEIIHQYRQGKSFTLSFVALLLAWSVSISVGYNTPALFVGGLISLLLFDASLETKESAITNKLVYGALAAILLVFYFTRTQNIYRDLPASRLTYRLDGIVEGADGIYTNKNTFIVLQELDSLKKSIPNLVVIPDFTACNILHAHESKILTEWPNKTEIPNEPILEKVTSRIKNDTALIVAVPVFQTALLKDGFTPQENGGREYAIVRFVKEHYTHKHSIRYFELYRH